MDLMNYNDIIKFNIGDTVYVSVCENIFNDITHNILKAVYTPKVGFIKKILLEISEDESFSIKYCITDNTGRIFTSKLSDWRTTEEFFTTYESCEYFCNMKNKGYYKWI